MSDVVENLANEGGRVLVTALATGLVGAVRRIPQLWRGVSAEERMTAELERSAGELASAGPEDTIARSRVAIAWETRLRDLLLAVPEARPELEALLAELRQEHALVRQTTTQHITASGSNSLAQGVIGGNIYHTGASAAGPGAAPHDRGAQDGPGAGAAG
ncbi:hypothetical protein [Streptomyces sp. MMG1121]|uniref:hypothetical protein n=1 Tax=Streptomyces sp. MMG1121 TaxID=1415544 RepID=UPI0006AEFE08|nr:hypothetical protein [Streptomyces sp. MMG1121]KOV67517.1 hypothetical protein ADK64_09200 [Streptomyces sp. MMG1121]